MGRPERLQLITRHVAVSATLAFVLGLPCTGLTEQRPNRSEAESRLDQVTFEIGKLKNKLEASRADHREELSRIREVDLTIQRTNQTFRSLEIQADEHRAELAELKQQRDDFLDSLDERLDQLAEQLRTSYRMRGQSRMKLVLNQDNPGRVGRMLAYYDYLNRAQVREISGLKDALTTLDELQQSVDRELMRIETVQNEQRAVLNELSAQREERAVLLSQLSDRVNSEELRLRELEQNRKDLEALLERLTDVLADIPADLGSRAGVAQQKGKLPMPLKGPVKHAFGQPRVGGLHWQGWLIGSEPGLEVGAVAYGRVAFADWLRGYGLMLIIDHGQGYLSLYGHNESLLHEAGTWVEPGEIIGIVGSNPGSDQGLYFELRKDGKAMDPAAWLRR
ncbi:MAG: peptidoglycan DD-metalloendopeptidase family protein [Xanthomonadales bacterium]|nr:peptidoglycan DD-metalloendopeptidase family protein [Gammaproteobacteria bacterium]MBT8054992.1 peptidoglycan DD-metalloendopeptidase family protein [Gammaproteobacteria bacterium]NND56374.1 peptidoglycan DD-metalloendopeptidase family protein [Xanthomonadales bacterium]NNK50431.1 peptidoglycan DD-metalloendopeptidase family protein [Xanthomonadales bacterium]